jgi:hypothetical protein
MELPADDETGRMRLSTRAQGKGTVEITCHISATWVLWWLFVTPIRMCPCRHVHEATEAKRSTPPSSTLSLHDHYLSWPETSPPSTRRNPVLRSPMATRPSSGLSGRALRPLWNSFDKGRMVSKRVRFNCLRRSKRSAFLRRSYSNPR